jgi:hypothetical protein
MSKTFLMCSLTLLSAVAGAAAETTSSAVFESPVTAGGDNPIDRIVLDKLKALGIEPALCSDAVFVRRAYLDVIGKLPTAGEAKEFIQDTDTENKRRRLIDRLLQRDEYCDYWAMRWGDVLRIKAEFPVNLWPNAAQAYHRWVRASIAENKSYDRFARELLTSSGSNFRVGPVNFYRAIQNRTPEGIAGAVALTFLGTRFDTWSRESIDGMSAFFSQIGYKPTREWKEENVFWDPLHTATTEQSASADASKPDASKPDTPGTVAAEPIDPKPIAAIFPDGRKVELSPDRDPREVFADWLINADNRWFARCMVNRQWAWLLGRGIVHEPDDIRPDNPPSNPELLEYLEKKFVASGYDLKSLQRMILNSQTYQLSSMPKWPQPEAEANFAAYHLRRLDAEVLIDAINQIAGASDLYTSAIPEPFTYIPQNEPAVAIADGSITSPFLALFGRSARATGMESERVNKPVPAQALHLLNSSHIQKKLEQGPKLKAILDSGRKPPEIIDELYLTILSRFPTPDEVKNIEEYGSFTPPNKSAKPSGSKRRENWLDVAWALINSTEFLYRH